MKKKEKIIGSIVILCISVVFILIGYTKSTPKESVNAINYKEIFVETDKTLEKKDSEKVISVQASNNNNVIDNDNNTEESNIKVDIKGAVTYPGVYEIKKDSRVADLLKLAGGQTVDADLNATNLSAKLKDEDCIVIYKRGEVDKIQNIQNSTNDSTALSTQSKQGTININTADKEQLKTLAGIGDVKADSIIKYREENGGFKSVDQLIEVNGIGEKTLSKFIDKVDIK